MKTSKVSGFLAVYLGAVAVALLSAGCEVTAEAPPPPGIVVGPPVVDVGPSIEVVDEQGYHHHGYYDHAHHWHGYYEDAHHVHHDDPADWHHR
jgi:hypothetical protein